MSNSNTVPDNSIPDEPKIIWDFDPRNLSAEYLRAIGLMAAASCQTESVLGKFIGGLLGIDAIEAIALTNNMAIPLKNQVVRAISELKAPDLGELDKIDDLMDRATEAFDKRNTTLHNDFMIHPQTKEVYSHRLKVKGSLQLELRPVAVEEIEKDATMLYEIGMDIMRFMNSRDLYPAFPTKPLRSPPDRSKKARTARRNNNV